MAITAGVGPQSFYTSGTTSFSVTLTGCTAGRSVMVLLSWQDATNTVNPTSVTCSGETVTALGSKWNHAGAEQSFRWYKIDALGTGGSKTVTADFGSSLSCSISAHEFAGMATGSHAIGTVNSGSGGTSATAEVTTTVGNCATFAVQSNDAGSSTTPSTAGYVDWLHPGPWFASDVAHNVDVGDAGLKSMSFNAVGGGWQALLLAIAPAASGPSTPRTLTTMGCGR